MIGAAFSLSILSNMDESEIVRVEALYFSCWAAILPFAIAPLFWLLHSKSLG